MTGRRILRFQDCAPSDHRRPSRTLTRLRGQAVYSRQGSTPKGTLARNLPKEHSPVSAREYLSPRNDLDGRASNCRAIARAALRLHNQRTREKAMRRLCTPLTLLSAFGMLCGSASAATAPGSPNDVIAWNKTLLSIVRTPGAQPATLHPTRSFALLHAAIYDAVNSIDSRHQPYLVHVEHVSLETSREAAVDAAAHVVLVSLYPAFQTTLDAQLQQELAAIPDGPDKASGVSVGEAVAQAILTLRSDDGSAAPPVTLNLGNGPGVYQSTPPNFPKPAFTQWSHVRPFALRRANQFRPGPPPALLSARYTAVFDEVKSLGMAGSVTATADQQLIGRFWGGAIQNYWNEIAQTTAQTHSLSLTGTARLFALLNITLADSVIAFYDAKYTYVFWRPVTAIRAAVLPA